MNLRFLNWKKIRTFIVPSIFLISLCSNIVSNTANATPIYLGKNSSYIDSDIPSVIKLNESINDLQAGTYLYRVKYRDARNESTINKTNVDDSILDDDLNDSNVPEQFVPSRSITFDEVINELTQLMNDYEQTKNIDKLRSAVITFGEIPKITKSLNNNIVKNSTALNDLFNSIRLECYNRELIVEQEVLVKLFAEEIFLGWKYDKSITHFKNELLIDGLINYNLNRLPNIQDRLNYLLIVFDFYDRLGDPFPGLNEIPEIDNPADTENGPIETPPNFPPSITEDEDDFYGDIEISGPSVDISNGSNDSNGDESDNNSNESYIEETYNISTYYKAIDNRCYKIKEITQNGITKEVDRVLVDKSEYIYCGIYDYTNFGDGYSSGQTIIDEDYLENDQNQDSSYFVYYTTTNNDKAPYYYNTGIRASADGKTISFNQLKDSMYHLALKNKSFTTDSNNESLYIIDGKPVVLRKTVDDTYTQKDIDRILAPFNNLHIKIMKDTEYEKHQSMYDKVQNESDVSYINELVIDGVSVLEKRIAYIENNVIKISIETLCELLSAKATPSGNNLTIKKGKNEIILSNGKKEYKVNGEVKEFLTPVSKSGDKYISELADIPTLLGYTSEYNSNDNTLVFIEMK